MRSRVIGVVAIPALVALIALAQQQEIEPMVGGVPASEALQLGKRMYREGILPSGEPMRAFVQRDIEVEGTMFSCQSCHLRAGRGSIEGTVVTLPTCGSWLSKPLVGTEMKEASRVKIPGVLVRPPYRPAYTNETLGRAIRLGRDPNDRQLNYVMPRYVLTSAETDILIHYLWNLSANWSPGVDDTTLRFATVTTSEVPDDVRLATVATLQAMVRDHNSQVRHEDERVRRGPWYKEEKWTPYRRYSLSEWRLEGAPSTWRSQLDAYYEAEPVFALVGGITTGAWEPIHRFSEEREVPCLFPVTDYPVISETDWYTLYFSKGFYQEGEGAARYLRRTEPATRDAAVVEVVPDDRHGAFLARGFEETRELIRMPRPQRVPFPSGADAGASWWQRLAERQPGAVWVLWIDGADLTGLEAVAALPGRPRLVIVAGSRVGDPAAVLPKSVRGFTYLTHAEAMADDMKRTRFAIERWLTLRDIPVVDFAAEAKMYFVNWMMAGAVKMMRDDFYRDYLLDIMDMMRDQDYAIGVYPRLSFGPGQRYASKGCYIVQLEGDPPKLVKRSDWVIH